MATELVGSDQAQAQLHGQLIFLRQCSKFSQTLGTKAARSKASTRGEDVTFLGLHLSPSCLLVIVRPQMTVNSGGNYGKLTFGKGTKLSVKSSKC